MANAELFKTWKNTFGNLEKHNATKTYKGNETAIKTKLPTLSFFKTKEKINIRVKGETKKLIEKDDLAKADHYQIVEEIARGGMGVVFKAYQNSLQREVAIKKLVGNASCETKQHRFISESLVTAYLDHPGIVPVHELGEAKDGILLAMKLVGGTSWKNLIDTEKLTLKEHLNILVSVCNAVAFAHSKAIIHNDLKPENIMVGEFGEILVMDWGIATDINKDVSKARGIHKSMVSEPMGTPHYMPIELAEGDGEKIGPWTDVYLLGGILCYILTKKPPHTGKTIWAILSSIDEGATPLFDKETHQELRDICKKALRRSIGERYQCIRKFQSKIQDFLHHQESIVLAHNARKILDECNKTMENVRNIDELPNTDIYGLYNNFAQAISGFHQSLQLWKNNKSAKEGEIDARLTYAETALRGGDLGLAESQLAKSQILDNFQPRIANLLKRIDVAKEKRDSIQKTTKILRLGLATAIVIIFVTLVIGFFTVKMEQQRTYKKNSELKEEKRNVEIQRNIAKEKAKEAKKNEKEAKTNEAKANANQVKANKLRKRAEEREKSVKIKLARIALIKAGEAANANPSQWGKSAVYAANALENLKGIDKENDLVKKGRDFFRQALRNNLLIWKANIAHASQSQISFSPDSKTIACGSAKEVKLLKATSGKLITTLKSHIQEVTSASFSPNGKILASASRDKTIKLWDMASKKLIATLRGHIHEVTSISFSPNGKILASASLDYTTKLWDVANKKLIATLKGHIREITSISFSPNGKILASASHDKTIKLWDVTNAKLITTLRNWKIYSRLRKSISFSPNGRILASSSDDKTVRLWDVANRKLITTLKNHPYDVTLVSFSPNGRILASVSNKTIRLWDVTNRKLITTLRSYYKITAISFSPNGNTLASTFTDKTIRLWYIFPKKPFAIFKGIDHISSISPNGKMQAFAYNSGLIDLWNITSKSLTATKNHIKYANTIGFSPNGKLWKVIDKKRIVTLKTYNNVSFITFSPNSKILAYTDGKTVELWDIIGKKNIATLKENFLVNSLNFSSDGKRLAIGSFGVKLWDMTHRKLIAQFDHDSEVSSLRFSANDKVLASGGHDKTIRLWNTDWDKQTTKDMSVFLEPITTLKGHTNIITSISFSSSDKILASASLDKTVRIWDVTSGDLISIFKHPAKSVNFTPDGKALAISGEKIALYNATIGKQKLIASWHLEKKISSIRFSQGGNFLRVHYKDKTIRFWDIAKGKEISLIHPVFIKWEVKKHKKPSCSHRFAFRGDIPSWLVEIALVKKPQQITQALFEWQIKDDFSLEKNKPISLEHINYKLWNAYKNDKQVSEYDLILLSMSDKPKHLDTVASIYAWQQHKKEAIFFAHRALRETPVRVDLLLTGLIPKKVEELLDHKKPSYYLLLLINYKKNNDQQAIKQVLVDYQKIEKTQEFGWKILQYYANSLSEKKLFAIGNQNGKNKQVCLCKFHYYVGIDYLLKGNLVKARRHFENCIKYEVKGLYELNMAKQELRLLDEK